MSLGGLEELELAYAITIHKAQGSEYPAVVIPLLFGAAYADDQESSLYGSDQGKILCLHCGTSGDISFHGSQ